MSNVRRNFAIAAALLAGSILPLAPLASQSAVLLHVVPADEPPDGSMPIPPEVYAWLDADLPVHVGQLWNVPPATSGVYNPSSVGIQRTGVAPFQAWHLENRKPATLIQPGTAFVFVLGRPPATAHPIYGHSLRHVASAANTVGNVTLVSHPALDGQPLWEPVVTEYDPTTDFIPEHDDVVYGAWYVPSEQRWGIFRQDLESIAAGTQFNLCVGMCGARETALNATTVDCPSPILNSCPLQAPGTGSPRELPLAGLGWATVYDDHPIGVWWSNVNQRWLAFNEDQVNLPAGTLVHYRTFRLIFETGFETGDTFGWSTVTP